MFITRNNFVILISLFFSHSIIAGETTSRPPTRLTHHLNLAATLSRSSSLECPDKSMFDSFCAPLMYFQRNLVEQTQSGNMMVYALLRKVSAMEGSLTQLATNMGRLIAKMQDLNPLELKPKKVIPPPSVYHDLSPQDSAANVFFAKP